MPKLHAHARAHDENAPAWSFDRRITLGELIGIASIMAGLFVIYGRFAVIESKVELLMKWAGLS